MRLLVKPVAIRNAPSASYGEIEGALIEQVCGASVGNYDTMVLV